MIKFNLIKILKVLGWGWAGLLLAALIGWPVQPAVFPVGVSVVQAQTGAPPPPAPVVEIGGPGKEAGDADQSASPMTEPGIPIVQPVSLPVLPANMEAIPGNANGAVVRIPADDRSGAIGQITFTLGDGIVAVLNVPATPQKEQLLRAVALSNEFLPAALPEWVNPDVAHLFEFSLFECAVDCSTTGQIILQHNPPLELIIRPPDGLDPATLVLLRFDKQAGQYQVINATLHENGNLQFALPQTSNFVLSSLTDPDHAPVIPSVVVPTGLPRTGGGGNPVMLWGSLLAGGIVALLGWFFGYHRKKRSTL